MLLASILPFIKGFTLLYWATATWWIPMLVALGVWRYVVRKVTWFIGNLACLQELGHSRQQR